MRSVSPNVRSPGPNKNNSAGVKVSPNSSKGNLKNQILPPINKKDKGQKTLPNTQSSQNINRQNVNNSPYVSNSQNKLENSPYESSQSPVKEEKGKFHCLIMLKLFNR